MAWRIGVDSGGTFTDICLFDEEGGHIAVWKVSSTSTDPSHAVAEGIGEGLARLGQPDREIQGSQQTLRWREQSGANSSLDKGSNSGRF
jgi:N-methylhydantoinase A/oxoprolinase/acetone carboxylase beta subunit